MMQLSSLQENSRGLKNTTKIEFESIESPKLELKLKLSPPREHWSRLDGVVSMVEISPSPPSSCVSRETSPEANNSSSSMVLVGCPRCLMYVMLLGSDPKCPKCKSTVLLDFLREDRARRITKLKI